MKVRDALQDRVDGSPLIQHQRQRIAQLFDPDLPVQRSIRLTEGEGESATVVDNANAGQVLDFLGKIKPAFREAIQGDLAWAAGLERLITTGEHAYGSSEQEGRRLMEDIRRSSTMRYRDTDYRFDSTLRGKEDARDEVFLVQDGEQPPSVLKRGPDLTKEIAITSGMDHPNVIRMLDAEVDRKSAFRMEHARLGTLSGFLNEGAPGEPQRKQLAKGVINGLEYVHQQHVIHGDMGTKNIFVDGTGENPTAKVADFGQSQHLSDENRSDFPGDVVSGCTALLSLVNGLESPEATGFREGVTQLRALAVEKNLAGMGGEAVTANDVQTLQERWSALKSLAWLA